MKIEKRSQKTAGSCNFCSRGELSNSGTSLNYPYDYVYCLDGTGIGVNVCPDCANQFIIKTTYEEL